MGATGFSFAKGIELGILANQAYAQYEAEQKGEHWSVPEGYSMIRTLRVPYEEGDISIGFIAKKENDIYIVWRGTKTPAEWVQDAKYPQVQQDFFPRGVKTELGFSQLYTTANGEHQQSPREICRGVLERAENVGTVYVTGHSLGAALAVFNALDIVLNIGYEPIMYSFAGPRVGNWSFARLYNQRVKNSWRVVNTNDIVPKLPAAWMFSLGKIIFYKHVANEHPVTFGSRLDIKEDHYLPTYIEMLKQGK